MIRGKEKLMKYKRYLILIITLFMLLCGSACLALMETNKPVSSASVKLISIELFLPPAVYSQPEQRRRFVAEVIQQIKTLPRVQAVAAVSRLADSTSQKSISVFAEAGIAGKVSLIYNAVTPEYADTVKMPLISGRFFTEKDGPNLPGVVILSQSTARSLFPNSEPIGKRISFSQTQEQASWLTVVGVASDALDNPAPARAEIYAAYNQDPTDTVSLIVRADSKSQNLIEELKSLLQLVDAQVSIVKVRGN
jgi:putative ABC transport system permease protein